MVDTVLGELLMKAIELLGDIDDQHRLMAQVPEDLPIGPVRVIVLVPEEDEAGAEWPRGAAREWTEELTDSRQDIYTLDDGQPTTSFCGPFGPGVRRRFDENRTRYFRLTKA